MAVTLAVVAAAAATYRTFQGQQVNKKAVSFAVFGWTALCVLPWFLVPVGILFCACAMFWIRIIGESCVSNTFTSSPTANKVHDS